MLITYKNELIAKEYDSDKYFRDVQYDYSSDIFKEFEIIKVYQPSKYQLFNLDCIKTLKPIWERETDVLDEKEKEYLSAVIKPFKKNVNCIIKQGNERAEYLEIDVKKNMSTFLPNFEAGSMYKGMELDKQYTLKELGLE